MKTPAADGGLPGPLPFRIEQIPPRVLMTDLNGNVIASAPNFNDRRLRELCAWINAQSALLAEKDAEIFANKREIAALRMQIKGHGATISRQSKAHGETIRQLATATERLASAEAVIAPFDILTKEDDRLPDRAVVIVSFGTKGAGVEVTMKMKDFRAARAWLTPKDGEKQP